MPENDIIVNTSNVLSMVAFEASLRILSGMAELNNKIVYLICTPFHAGYASDVIDEFRSNESNIALMLRYVDYLSPETWFITDGNKVVWHNPI